MLSLKILATGGIGEGVAIMLGTPHPQAGQPFASVSEERALEMCAKEGLGKVGGKLSHLGNLQKQPISMITFGFVHLFLTHLSHFSPLKGTHGNIFLLPLPTGLCIREQAASQG